MHPILASIPLTMKLNLAHATSIANASLVKARELGVSVSVAVCNAGGRMIVFFKMDGPAAHTGHEAMRRAIGAAGSENQDARGDWKEDDHASQTSTVVNEGLGCSHRPGGLALTVAGENLGAVGVSAVMGDGSGTWTAREPGRRHSTPCLIPRSDNAAGDTERLNSGRRCERVDVPMRDDRYAGIAGFRAERTDRRRPELEVLREQPVTGPRGIALSNIGSRDTTRGLTHVQCLLPECHMP